MTQHEQKPESAEFRTREELEALASSYINRHYLPEGWSDVGAMVAEMMASGAAEQRRKDAEGAEAVAWVPVHPKHGEIWPMTSGSPHPERMPQHYPLSPLYTRPANVTTLEARVKELEGEAKEMRSALAPFAECAVCFDASGNDYERDYPDEFSLGGEDDEDALSCLNVGHFRVARSVHAAAIREGGEV